MQSDPQGHQRFKMCATLSLFVLAHKGPECCSNRADPKFQTSRVWSSQESKAVAVSPLLAVVPAACCDPSLAGVSTSVKADVPGIFHVYLGGYVRFVLYHFGLQWAICEG